MVVPGQLFQDSFSGSHWYSRIRVPFSGLISISLVALQSSPHLLLPLLLLSHCNKSGVQISTEGFPLHSQLKSFYRSLYTITYRDWEL